MNKQKIIDEINWIKKEQNVVILAHSYANTELDAVADYIGDSLYLSRKAAETNADIIVFAGVYFMAETAKILSPNKKVILPKLNAGCAMADMITVEKLRKFKEENDWWPVVCYINSSAAVKAESDICCTSANAIKIIESLKKEKVLLVPDKNLAAYANSKISWCNIIGFNGYCPVHNCITELDVKCAKANYPDALFLAHPECSPEVLALADFVGSTSAIMKFAKESTNRTFIIGTEIEIASRLKKEDAYKNFYSLSPKVTCKDMKSIFLEDILKSLKYWWEYEINVDNKIAEKARISIQRMLEIK